MHSVFRARVFASATTNRLMARVFAIVLAGVLMAWMLAKLRTGASPAGARSVGVSGRGVNGKNGRTKLSVPQRDGSNLIHSHPPFRADDPQKWRQDCLRHRRRVPRAQL